MNEFCCSRWGRGREEGGGGGRKKKRKKRKKEKKKATSAQGEREKELHMLQQNSDMQQIQKSCTVKACFGVGKLKMLLKNFWSLAEFTVRCT